MANRPKGRRYKPMVLMAGVSGAENVYKTTLVDTTANVSDEKYAYGDTAVNSKNAYLRYQDLTKIEPYVFLCLEELGLAIGRGLEFRFPEDDKPAKAEEMLKNLKEFRRRVHFDEKFAASGKLLGQEGTNIPVLVYYGPTEMDDKGEPKKGIKLIQFAPMPYTTLIPEGYRPGQFIWEDKDVAYGAMLGEIDKVVLNEQTPLNMKVLDKDQFVLIRNAYEGFEWTDIQGRKTIGLYGMSLLEPLQGTIRAKHNILDSYVACIKRYGHMKLWFEYEALQNLLENQNINMTDAKKVLDQVKGEIKKIRANEDLVTAGFKIEPIEHSEININVGPALEYLNKTISDALLGCDAGKSDSSNTYASSYIAEYRKLLVMESLRRQIKTAYEEILKRHLVACGYSEKDSEKVQIYLDPIQESNVTAADYLAMYLNGLITDQTLFDKLGLNIKGEGKKYDPANDPKMQLQMKMIEEKSKAVGTGTGKTGAKPTGASKTSPSTVKNEQKNKYEANTE